MRWAPVSVKSNGTRRSPSALARAHGLRLRARGRWLEALGAWLWACGNSQRPAPNGQIDCTSPLSAAHFVCCGLQGCRSDLEVLRGKQETPSSSNERPTGSADCCRIIHDSHRWSDAPVDMKAESPVRWWNSPSPTARRNGLTPAGTSRTGRRVNRRPPSPDAARIAMARQAVG